MLRPGATILQVIPELDSGGAERTTLEVAEAIVEAGGRALIVTKGGRLVESAEALGANVILRDVESKNPIKLFANAQLLLKLIRAHDVDIIHARSRAPAWSSEYAARRSGIAFVTTYHGAYNEQNQLKRAYNAVMARGDLVIANSPFIADLIKQRYHLNDDKIRVINRGVDLAAFDRAAISQDRLEQMRATLGLSDIAPSDQPRPIVLHPARLTRWKGQLTVIEAAAKLKLMRPNAPPPLFVLAGNAQGRDAYEQELRRAIASQNLDDDVIIPGHLDDMPAVVALSELVVIASTEPEAFGRTSVEAQALGVPVIATNVGGPMHTVVDKLSATTDRPQTGWLVEPGSSAALAGTLNEAISIDRDMRERIAGAARQHAQSEFSKAQLQRRTMRVYGDLLARFRDL